jgi:hypothetical protein
MKGAISHCNWISLKQPSTRRLPILVGLARDKATAAREDIQLVVANPERG